ncbi:MAG TPA: hypothetical protein PKL85_06575 [Bacteroidia bacterium]|nr:hypothetical protein [Bacteroidia bacterium]
MNNSFFNSAELIRSIIRWKKHLIIVGLISLGASILFSSPWFIKPKYKSFALAYPSNLIAYSTESATEQMLQLAQSSDIRERIIHDFDLYKHYDIDTVNNKHFRTDVIKMYEENVTIKKTEYESMEITVLDEDPVVASNMVDSIIHFFDVKARSLQAEKSAEVMVIAKNQLDQKLVQMDSMEERLRTYRTQYGILDYKEQSKEATRGYLRGLSSGNQRATAEAKVMLDALREKGGEFNSLNEHLWRVRGNYNDLKLVYENAVRDVTKKLTYANVVSRPSPSDKKAYPIRWLIVLISVGSSLFLAFMILLIFNSKKEFSR